MMLITNSNQENYEKYYKIKLNYWKNKDGEIFKIIHGKEKKENIDVFEAKEVKEKSLEDIRNSPIQEIELKEFSNDAKTKVVKSKKKLV
jgi:hypothetical protein